MSEKCWGVYEDDYVRTAFDGIIQFTGEKAFDKLDRIIQRISVKRFEKIKPVLDAIRFFGAQIDFLHEKDVPSHARLDYRCYQTEGRGLMGAYIPVTAWIEIPIDAHRGWKTVEETLRHECVHLLQDVLSPPRSQGSHALLMDHVMSSFGQYMSRQFKEHAEEVDYPAFEVEAYTLETWVMTMNDAIDEVKRRPDLWKGYTCPIND